MTARRIAALLALVAAVSRPCAYADPVVPSPAPTGDVRGFVFGPDGRPAVGVTVVADAEPERRDAWLAWSVESVLRDAAMNPSPAPRRRLATAVSGLDGSFSLANLALDQLVRVNASPVAPLVSTAVVTAPDPSSRSQVVVRLVKGRPLRIHVAEAAGAAVARLDIRPVHYGMSRDDSIGNEGDWSVLGVATDGKGDARIAAVPDGAIAVSVAVPGVGGLRRVALTPESGELALSLRDGAGGVIEGEVRDAAGKPVPDAVLAWATGTWAEPVVRLARSDADGRYRVDAMPAGDARLARAVASGRFLAEGSSSRWSHLRMNAGAVARSDVTLAAAGSVRGRVTDASGAPVAGVEIALAHEQPREEGERTQRTDADGRYVFDDVRVGRGWIDVGGAGPVVQPRVSKRSFRQNHAVPFAIVEPGAVLTRDFAIRAATPPPLDGRVLDEDGKPVAGAIVTATRWLNAGVGAPAASAASDASGAFHVEPPVGYPEWGLVASLGERDSETTIAKLGQSGVVLKLEKRASLSGRVVSAEGVPLGGVHVTPCAEEEGFSSGAYSGPGAVGATVVTDADGRFELRGLHRSAVTLQLFHRGAWLHPFQHDGGFPSGSKELVWFELERGQRKSDVLVKALPTGSLGGTLLDGAGKPVPLRTLRFDLEDPSVGHIGSGDATTDRDGRFRADGLVRGKYAVHLVDASVGTIETGTLDARLAVLSPAAKPRRVVEGTVVGPDGKPVARAQVRYLYGRSVEGTGRVVDGRFHEVAEPDGETVRIAISDAYDASGNSLETLDESVEVPGGQLALAVHLRAAGFVAGRVVDSKGAGVGAIVVTLDRGMAGWPADEGLGDSWTMTRADGAFRLTGLEPRDYTLRVRPEGDWIEPRATPVVIPASDVRVVMMRGVRVLGRVENTTKGSSFGVETVSATWSGPSAGSIDDVATGRDGSFSLVVPEDAEHLTLHARSGAPDWPFPSRETAVANDVKPGTGPITLKLSSGETVAGTVVGPAGEPVASGWVMLLEEPDDPKPKPSPLPIPMSPFDGPQYGGIKNGAFSVENVPIGTRRLVAIPKGDEFSPSDVVSIDVPALADAKDTKIIVPRSVGLTLQVAGAEKEPCFATWRGAAADGTVIWRSGLTAEGHVTLMLPPKGGGFLYVRSKSNDRYAVVEGLSADAPVMPTVALKDGLSITGTVEGVSDEDAAESRAVIEGGGISASTKLGKGASFEFHGLPRGSYSITVTVPGPVTFASSEAVPTFDAGEHDVVIKSGIRRQQRR